MKRTGIYTVVAALVCVMTGSLAFAVPISQLDQANMVAPSGYNSISLPMGQEFTPTLTGLNQVDLKLWDWSGSAATIYVNIRQGTLTGPVLGTSNALVLPAGTDNGFNGASGWTEFDFASVVPLTPGNLYVMEIVKQGGNWAIGANAYNPYPGGRVIWSSGPYEGTDIWFREGLTPEPATLALLAFGGLGMLLRRRRK